MADISVSVVDDHPLLLAGIASLMQRKPGFLLVAVGSSARDIYSIISNRRIDTMIVDLNMPGDVFQAIFEASSTDPNIKIIVFTASTKAEDAIKALDAGASGYVLKGSPGEELIDAIEVTRRGETYISPTMATALIAYLQNKSVLLPAEKNCKLNIREDQIVKLLLYGKTNKEIGAILSISAHTVKAYMTNLMEKFNVRTRLEVVVEVQRRASEPLRSNAPAGHETLYATEYSEEIGSRLRH